MNPIHFRTWNELVAAGVALDIALHYDRSGGEVPPDLAVPVVAVGSEALDWGPQEWEAVLFTAAGQKPRKHPLQRLVGFSRPILEFKRQLLRVSASSHPLLLTGENGTGKDLAANLAHELSDRAESAFVAVNCSAIPVQLAESLLFGSVRGAYTDAENRHGYCQEAQGGTLFLDEIGELPPEVQAKLLRVLENQEVRRVGSNKSEKVNFRLISATNRNLAERVRLGLFREDLYYRINVLTIRMPALRDRRDDIPHLVRHFSKLRVSHSALEKLCGHDWPGNLRQLRNVIVRAEVLHDTGELDEHHLDFGD
ncbi:MAG: sigma-54 dependent transcriptional regulator [Spirochaetales bacterium]